MIDDYQRLTVAPIEVKSGKDYKRHVAISRLVSTEDYGIHEGYVLSNAREVERSGGIVYMPIYYSMFFDNRLTRRGPVYI